MFQNTTNPAMQILTGMVAVVMALSMSFGAFAPTSAYAADSAKEICLEAQAQGLNVTSGTFAQLCAQYLGTTTTTNNGFGVPADFRFTQNLTLGSRSNEVMMLQKFLNSRAETQISTVGAGSPGQETMYFGNLTRTTLANYQRLNGITPASGYFGPLTRASVNAMIASSTGSDMSGDMAYGLSCDFRFTERLAIGSRSAQVMNLQKMLNAVGGDFTVATSGAGSMGQETSYYGGLTAAAVADFQEANVPNAITGGVFGLNTRTAANALIAAKCADMDNDDNDNDSNDNDSNSGDGDLEVDGGDQPRDMVVGQAQILIPTTVIELTADDEDVDVMSVMVEITGNGQDGVDEVQAWIDGKIVDTDSVDSDDEAELELNIEVEEGETVEVTFSVSMEADLGESGEDVDGLEFELRVTEIEADGDVDGLPVTGAEHQIRDSLDLNTYDLDIDNEGSDVQVGDDEELLATFTVSNTSDTADSVSPAGDVDDESIFVWQLVVEHTGTADLSDLDNVMLVDENGDEYEADVMGDYLMFDIDGLEIEDNDEMEFELFADIEDGSGDYVLFNLDDDDLAEMFFVVDEDDRYLAERSGAVSVNTDAADRTQILAGDGNASDSSEVNDDEIAVGQEDAYFASFELDIEGEDVTGDVEVQMTIVAPTAISPSDVELDNIRIMDEDGNVVARSDDEDITPSTGTATNFDYDIEFDDVTFEEGDDQVFFIVADVSDDVENGTTYAVDDIVFSNFEGETSGDEADELNGNLDIDVTQTVEGAVLEAGVDSSLEDDETKDDRDEVEVAVVQLDATASGENIEVTEITLDFVLTDADTGGEIGTADLSNCALYDGDDVVSDEEDLSGANETLTETQAFDLDNDFMVEADTVRALSLRCDLSSDFELNDKIDVIVNVVTATTPDSANVDARSDNVNDITVGLLDNTSATLTIVNASITISEDAEPDMQTALAGDTVSLGFVEIDNEDVSGDVEELKLTATGREFLNSTRKVEIWEGDTMVGEAFFTSASVTVDDFTDFELEDSKSTIIEFRAKLANNVSTANQGSQVAVDITAAADGIRVDGDDYTTTATDFDGVKVYTGVPSFTVSEVTSSDLQDDVIMKFAISADGDDLDLAFADVSAAISVIVTGSATYTPASEQLFTGGSYSDAADEDDEVTNAEVITISEGSTEYFVVKAGAVSEGETGDIIETTVDLDAALEVEGVAIDPVEGDDVNNDEELTYKYTN